MLSINKQSLINFLIYFFVISNVIDIGGELGLKYISFLFISASLFIKPPKINTSKLIFFTLLIFFYSSSLIITQINGGDIKIAFGYNLFFPTTILLILVSENICKDQILDFIMNTLFYSSLMIFFGYFFSYIYPNDSIIDILKIFASDFDDREEMRPITMSIVPKIFFNFTLFLPSAFVYFLFRNNYLKSLILAISVLLSLSRAAIAISFLFLLIYIINIYSFKKFLSNIFLSFIFLILIIFIVDMFIPNAFIHFLNLNDSSLYTVSTRLDQLDVIYNVFSENIIYFFVGMGSGTPIYSNFLGMDIYNIEIAPLEILRKYGVFFFVLIFSLITKIIFQNFKNDKTKSYILIALLLCTFSNPILTAPIFIFLYILCYYTATKYINT